TKGGIYGNRSNDLRSPDSQTRRRGTGTELVDVVVCSNCQEFRETPSWLTAPEAFPARAYLPVSTLATPATFLSFEPSCKLDQESYRLRRQYFRIGDLHLTRISAAPLGRFFHCRSAVK